MLPTITLDKSRPYFPSAYDDVDPLDLSRAIGRHDYISLYQAIQLLVRREAEAHGATSNRFLHLWPFRAVDHRKPFKQLAQQVCYGVRRLRLRKRYLNIGYHPARKALLLEALDAVDFFDRAVAILMRFVRSDRNLLLLTAPTCPDMRTSDVQKSFLSSYTDQFTQTGLVPWEVLQRAATKRVQSPPLYLTAYIHKARLDALIHRSKANKSFQKAEEVLRVRRFVSKLKAELPNNDMTFPEMSHIVCVALERSDAWGHKPARSDEWVRKHFLRPLGWKLPSGPRERGTTQEEAQRARMMEKALAHAHKYGAAAVAFKR